MSQVSKTASTAVIVLGAYGSGSSAVAGILSRLGVMMGEQLIPPTPANPKGHFEDAEFRRLLYRLRRDSSLLGEIESFIRDRFARYPLWGVKEPAILEAINRIAPMLTGMRYRVIATHRDVDECVRSYLRKWPDSDPVATRRQIEFLHGQREEFIRCWRPEVLWVDFNRLTEQPEQYVQSIVDFVFGDENGEPGNPAWPSQAAIQAAIDSIDPAMNHRLVHAAPGSRRAVEIPFHEDPVLQKWVNPDYLRTETIARIREASKARPFCKYAVLDGFFNEAVLDAYAEQHLDLEFVPDDEGLPYDSLWARKRGDLGTELFYHEPWHRLLAEYTDTELVIGHGAASVKQRKHGPDSNGFWIHTDRTRRKPTVAIAALFYLNRNWKETDGGLLQLWVECERAVPVSADEVEFHWKDYKDKRLEFLNERYIVKTDLVAYEGIRPAEMFLIDQVLPEYNRLVVTDFVRDPCYHAITPSNGRIRYGVVQWLM